MANGSRQRHGYAVTVEDASGEALFERTYDLGARTADENRVFEGNPETVTVAVDDDPVEFQWDPDNTDCSKGTTTSLLIYHQLESEPDITPIYECNTPTG